MAAPVSAAGGMVFTSTVNRVRPDHPSMAGTFWGWNFRTNLNSSQSAQPTVLNGFLSWGEFVWMQLDTANSTAYNSNANPGKSGYMVFDRHDTSIDFSLGSSIRAELASFGGYHGLLESPVPGMMMGLQDRNGRFFGVGFAEYQGTRYLRIINNPFTGNGTPWVSLIKDQSVFNYPSTSSGLSVELVIAGSRASLYVSGLELRDGNGQFLRLDAGPPLTSLIFSQWQTYGGAVVGDYCTTSSGDISIVSLSYY